MKKIINFYKRLTFLQGVAFAVAFSSAIGVAVTVGSLTTFTPGTTIQSSQVNANFQALKTAIESVTSGQTYMGNHDASTTVDPSGATLPGEYYIITTAGTINAVSYAVGDWIMFDGTNYNKVPGSSTTVFGRSGAVVATEGDYSLDQLSAVTITSPSVNQVLRYNGSDWVNGAVSFTETDPSVQSFAQSVLPICTVGEVLKSDGTTFSCVTDNSGSPAFTGTASKAVVTNGVGGLATSNTTSIELDYLSGATANIQTQLGAKQNASSFVDWTSSGVQTIHPTRLNLTFANTVVTTDASGFVVTSPVTSTELGYLAGVTSSINTQFNNKANSSSPTFSGSVTSPFYSATSASAANNTSYRGSTAGTGMFFPSGTSLSLATNGTESMTISSSGNIGIGTPTPSNLLDIASNSQTVLAVKSSNVSSITSPTIKFQRSRGTNSSPTAASSGDVIGVIDFTGYGSGNYFPGASIEAQAAGTFSGSTSPGILTFNTTPVGTTTLMERMRIDQNGLIGVGTMTPQSTFDINTTGTNNALLVPRSSSFTGTPLNGMIRYDLTGNLFSFYQNGSWVNFTTVSDARLKTNVTSVKNALTLVNQLQPVYFDWDKTNTRTQNFSEKHQIGFLAQEVEKVLPEVVTKGADSYRSMEYGKMVAVVVGAVQELSRKVEILFAKDSSKEIEIEYIKEENRMLKRYLCSRDPEAPFCGDN